MNLALVALALGGCGDERVPLARVDQAVVGGVESGVEDDAVVALANPGGVCTGTLVADNLMLTARHCLTLGSPSQVACSADGLSLDPSMEWVGDYPPDQTAVFVGAGAPTDQDRAPAAYGARIFSTGSESICRNDIALVLLDRRLSNTPILPLRLLTGVSVGEEVSVVGYGMTGTLGESGRWRRDELSVLEVGKSAYSNEPSILIDRTFAVGTGPCSGDSGGPALSSAGAVMGVFSLSATDCTLDGAWNVFTQVAPFYDLVSEAFVAAEAEPWFEGDPQFAPLSRPLAGCQLGAVRCSGAQTGFGVALLLLLATQRARRRDKLTASATGRPNRDESS